MFGRKPFHLPNVNLAQLSALDWKILEVTMLEHNLKESNKERNIATFVALVSTPISLVILIYEIVARYGS